MCKNVFDLWLANGKVLPFKVRHVRSWHPSSYFVVKRIEISVKNWDYFAEKGKLYGSAFGDMYLRGQLVDVDIGLSNAGCYDWILV
jgi:hypothetical protein